MTIEVGIVAAMPGEGRCISGVWLKPGTHVELANGVVLRLSGIGPSNANKAASWLIAQGSRRLVSWGMAAGIDPSMRPGDLCIPGEISFDDGAVLETDQEWRARLHSVLADLKLFDGPLLHSSKLVDQPQMKACLYRSRKAAALDMESGEIARVAHQRGLPFVAIRAIVDSADMKLPRTARSAMSESGRIRLENVLLGMLFRVTEIPSMIALARAFRAAQKTLSSAAMMTGPALLAMETNR